MADIKINEKLVVSQTGSAEPVMASNVTIPATAITGVLPAGVTGGAGLNAVPAPAATAGQVLNIEQTWKPDDTGVWGQHGTSYGQDWTTFWNASYTPQSGSSKVYAFLTVVLKIWANVTSPLHVQFRYDISGSDVSDGAGTNIGSSDQIRWGVWGNQSTSYWAHWATNHQIQLREVTTLGGNRAITYGLQLQNPNATNGNCGWVMYGDGNKEQTSMLFVEVEY